MLGIQGIPSTHDIIALRAIISNNLKMDRNSARTSQDSMLGLHRTPCLEFNEFLPHMIEIAPRARISYNVYNG